MAKHVDVEKVCKERDCKKPFILTAGEQDFCEKMGYPMPARCPSCREKRKVQARSPFKSLKGKEFPGMEEPKVN